MFFTNQIAELIEDEKRAFRSYLIWLLAILLIGVIFILFSLSRSWSEIGSTLSSAFLLLLSKPPFSEMMKRREKIKTLTSLKKMALLAQPESKEADEIEKLVIKTFRDLLKS